ncbi:MAG: hypothetical protein M3311_06115 [Thermoproteota archaeon]|nr:hypothetical protein [Thermoproteota archaeon]
MRVSSCLIGSSRVAVGAAAISIAIAAMLLVSNFAVINAQPQDVTGELGGIENGATTTPFQSTGDSFSIQVPSGWIIQDIDNAGPAQLDEVRQGYGILMQLCPEEQAAPGPASPSGVGSSTISNTISSVNASRCLGAQEVIHIIRYPDLDTRLSANNITATTTAANNSTATIDNVLTYHMQKLQDVGYRSMQIVNSTDMTSNLIDPQTNETLTTVPGKLVEMTYSTNFAPNEMKRGYFILTAANETVPNVGTTKGYSVFYEGNSIIGTGITATTTTSASPILQPTPLPTAVQQAFDSFGLLAAPEATQAVVQTTQTGQVVQEDCDPSYPDVCIASPPPDLNCGDEGVPENFEVSGSDPHGFDGDNDGVGCESGSNAPVDNSNEDDGDNEGEEGGGESGNGVSGEPQPEPESEPRPVERGGVEGGVSGEPQPEPGEGGSGGGGEANEAGNNPNEFADCIVPEGTDPGDVGC